MNWKKIGLFLGLAYGISWLSAALLYFGGIEYGGFLAVGIVACLYMPAPAISALIVHKYIYKEPIISIGWRWSGINWKWIIFTILISFVMVLGTLLVMWVGGNQLGIENFGKLDFSTDGVIQKIAEIVSMQNSDLPIDIESQLSQLPFEFSAAFLIVISLLSAVFAAFTVNLPFMFGEEFGWRGLLMKETQTMGFWKSNLFIGVVWGLWHAPIILMGHNYPEYPMIDVGMMTLLCVVLSFPFAYVRYKTSSILGPCILHGMVNGTAALTLYFTWGGHSLFTGMTGVAGLVCLLMIVGLIVLDTTFIRNYKSFE